MPPSPTDKTKTIKNKKSKTIIQEARPNISTDNPNTSFSSPQNNSNSPNNDGRPQQVEKRKLSSSSEPNSPTQKTLRLKKLFISRNRFEVSSRTDPIEVDTITPNLDSDVNNSETPTPQVKKCTSTPSYNS